MSNLITRIEDIAFEEILRSTYETLNVECKGVLFGELKETKSRTAYFVESAHPIQLAIRCPNYIIYTEGSERSDWKLYNEQIGGYHSHPRGRVQENGIRKIEDGKVVPGKRDKRNLKEDQGKIEIITSLKRVKRKINLSENPFIVSGYIDNNGEVYRFDMGSYVYNGRIRRCFVKVSPKALRLVR